MSLASLLASVVLILVALNAGALTVIRLLWPLRVPAWVCSSPWIEDGPPPVSPAAAAPQAGMPGRPADRAERWRLAGMLAGLIGAVVVLAESMSIRGVLVAAPVFGVGVLVGTLAGELGMPAPTGQVRSAELRVRRTADYVPRGLGTLVCASAVVLAALVAVTTTARMPGLLSGPSEDPRCYVQESDYGVGLWPGVQNTVPALSVVLVGLVLAALTLRRVVRRPRSADVVRFDDVSRRRSAEVVTAAAGVLVLASCLSIAGTAGLTLRSLAAVCTASSWASNGTLLSIVALAAFLATAWCGAALILPSARRIGRRA
ncbi:hypothetical protein [Actinoplanes sp. NPDC089786]|uniref:hypothetical protein n=1 Tax=Actinoplanes sp. NPDC089786 TaxID=3155185 RepID=UPI003446828F